MVEQTVSIVGIFRDGIGPQLDKLRPKWKLLEQDVKGFGAGISRALAPLTSQLAALGTGILGAAAIQKAQAAAERKLAVDQRLVSALGGQRDQLAAIAAIAEKLEGKTLFDADDLKLQAATLLNMGVALNKIDESLQAAVDTATALNVPLELAVTSIGKFQSGQAGALGRLLPQLRQLQQQGTLQTQGVSTLQNLFRGQAEGAAGGLTGELFRARDAIEDTSAVIGKALLRIKVAILQGLQEPLQKVADFVESKFGKQVVDVLAKIAPAITKGVVALAGIVLGFNALRIAAAPFVAIITGLVPAFFSLFSIATKLFGLFAGGGPILKLVGIALGAIAGVSIGNVVDEAGELAGNIRQLFDDVATGKKTLEDVFIEIKLQLRIIGAYLETYVVDPIKKAIQFLQDYVEWLKGGFRNVAEGILGKSAVEAIIDEVSGATEALQKKAGEKLFDSAGLQQKIAAAEAEAAKERAEQVDKKAQEALDDIDAKREQAGRDFDTALAKLTAAEGQTSSATAGIKGVSLASNIAHASAGDIRSALATVDEEFAEPLKDLLQKKIAEAFQAGSISASQAVELAAATELDSLDTKSKVLDEQAVKLREQVASTKERLDLLTKLYLASQSSVVSDEDKLAVEQAFADVVEQQVGNERRLASIEEERLRLVLERKAAEEKVNEQKAAAAQRIVEDLQKERDRLNASLQNISASKQEGTITDSAATGASNAAIADFQARAAAAKQQLDAMRATWPEISAEIKKASDEIDKMTNGLRQAKVESDSFVDGFQKGIRQAADSLDTIGEVGTAVGAKLADSLSDGVVDVFVTGKQTAKEWAAQILSDIGRILIKAAVLQLLLGSIGGGSGGGGGSIGSTVAGSATGAVVQSALGGGGGAGGGGSSGGLLGLLGLGGGGAGGGGTGGAGGTTVNVTQGGGGGLGTGVSLVGSLLGTGGGGIAGGIGNLLTGGGGGLIGGLTGLVGGGLGAAAGGIGGLLGGLTGGFAGGTGVLGTLGSTLGGGIGGLFGGATGGAITGFGAGQAGGLLGALTGAGSAGLGAAGGGILGGLGGGGGLLGGLLGGGAGAGLGATGGLLSALGGGAGAALGPLGSILGPLLGGGAGGGVGQGVGSLLGSLLIPIPGVGGIVGGLLGSFLGFNRGGYVPGNPAAGDVVNAKLTGNEYVHPSDTVDYYTIAGMDAIKNRRVPSSVVNAFARGSEARVRGRQGFNTGGGVALGGGGSDFGGGAYPALVTDENNMERIFGSRNSGRSLERAIGRNRDNLRAALRIDERNRK